MSPPGRFVARLLVALVLGLLLAGIVRMTPARAIDEQCFAQTQHCVGAPQLQFWQRNGDAALFGFPLTEAHDAISPDTGEMLRVQWFERSRIEVHSNNPPPYDVQLGRIGAERLQQLGIDWQATPREPGPLPDCLWFEETGHNVCDQQPGNGFKTFWLSHGLKDTRIDPYGRSLFLFGMPLTEIRTETNASGATVMTQWFERARFEWHPGNAARYRVLLGLVGAESLPPGEIAPSRPAPVTTAPEESQPAPVAAAPEGANDFASRIIARTNEYRQQHGCPPLAQHPQLMAAAQNYADAMANEDFFSHTAPNGSTFRSRIRQFGYPWNSAAENIAGGIGSPEDIVDAWFDQEPPNDIHRRNILNCALKDIGVGYVYLANDPGKVTYQAYWVQDLASP
jgi:uncharacterized protein YkwD